MKKLFLLGLLFTCAANLFAQTSPPRLIVRGDDAGFSHSGNEALIKSFTHGIETSVEVIVPSPWFLEAAKLLNQNPGVDVGIHLTLTSEWDYIKWRPLTACPGLRDSNGYFFPMVYPNKNYPGQSVSEQQWKLEDVEKEFRAQIEMGLKLIPRISHVSAHMGCTALSPQVEAMARRLAKAFGIDIDLTEKGVQWVGYEGPSKTAAEKQESFIKTLQKLEAGKTYWFIDHPGFDSDELRAIYHIGYEGVAADRQGVTELFTSEKVKAVIKELGIVLIGYKELK